MSETDNKMTPAMQLEVFKFQTGMAIDFANSLIKALLYLNGGAAMSFLALLGYLHSSQDNAASPDPLLVFALLCFGIGSFLAVTTGFFAYLCQRNIALSELEDMHNNTAKASSLETKYEQQLRIALSLVLFSLAFFICGLGLACFGLL